MGQEKAKSLEPTPLQDTIYLRNPFSSTRRPGPSTRRYLVYVLTGNPGLIEFYRPFMTALFARLCALQADAGDVVLEIYGRSLQGFEVASMPDYRRGRWWRPFGLLEQVRFVEERLCEAVAQMELAAEGHGRPRVILVGHSVGSYLLLELVRRHRERLERKMRGLPVNNVVAEPDIVGGICLFPTVMQINKSKKGRALMKLTRIPLLSVVAGGFVGIVTKILPIWILKKIAGRDGVMSERNVAITAACFKANGFHQALHLGFDEMRQITSDKWDEEVWGAVHPSPTKVPRPRLFFYFAESDPWVANYTRDDLMRMRGRGEEGDDWKPWMEIDKLEIPHAFCLEHSAPVAEKVAEYIDTIIKLEKTAVNTDNDGEFSLARKRLSRATTGSSRTSIPS